MRIIHLSDIHLATSNIEELKVSYMDKFLDTLSYINNEKQIDLIIISGDIIDKSGMSFSNFKEFIGLNPYDIFESEFLKPIINKIPSLINRIVFCAGNHDIESSKIKKITEAGLEKLLTSSQSVNELMKEHLSKNSELNLERLESFLQFERKVHQYSISTGDYLCSEFESKFLIRYEKKLIGIALINDSWRCSVKAVENNIIGTNQFHRCLKFFKENKTDFNIAVIHHPIETLIKFEQKEIEDLLHYQNFQVVFVGHEHNKRVRESNYGNGNKILELRGRSAFDKPHEIEANYQSGFSIVDIDFEKYSITCQFIKYYKNDISFKPDLEDGEAMKIFYFGVSEKIMEKVKTEKESFLFNLDKSKFINKPEDE